MSHKMHKNHITKNASVDFVTSVLPVAQNNEAIMKLVGEVRQICFELHTHLRHGHLERVYQRGLAHRFELGGIRFQEQALLVAKDFDDYCLAEFHVDFLVQGELIVEVKATSTLANEHIAQAIGYLRCSGLRHALLVNFGSPRVEFKKLIL